jgi:putative transcriptional regulator
MVLKKIEKGLLLISDPSIIGDSTFNRSVILLTEHNGSGSVGFVLNKPTPHTLHELIDNIHADFVVYDGGPVEQDNLYFIHTLPQLITNSIEIADGIYWGGDFELTKNLINEGQITKENIRFFLGYSGWTSNQLESEIELKSWIPVVNKHKIKLLQKSSKNFWKQKITALGGDYLLWSNAPENPILN